MGALQRLWHQRLSRERRSIFTGQLRWPFRLQVNRRRILVFFGHFCARNSRQVLLGPKWPVIMERISSIARVDQRQGTVMRFLVQTLDGVEQAVEV